MPTDQTEDPVDFDHITACLRADPQSMPWPQRRKVVAAVGEALERNGPTESTRALVRLLTDDPKWEVRKEAADLLPLLPSEDVAQLAAKLAEDSNMFVQKAAQQVLKRNRREQRDRDCTRRKFNSAFRQLTRLEKRYGKEAAEMARQFADDLLRLTASAFVHDVPGILTPLKAKTAMLQRYVDDGMMDPAVFRKALGKIADRLEFIERLGDDMQVYTSELTPACRRERLLDLVTEACDIARDHVLCGGHDPDEVLLSVRLADDITLDACRYLIVTAIANVVQNAYDAIAPTAKQSDGGRIGIRAKIVKDQVELSVRDNGIGMYAEHLREVCQFVPGRTTRPSVGTGFGLPIARRNIAAHGGSIDIASKENKGTTVTIILPRTQQKGGAK